MKISMLYPHHFKVNEAWIVFELSSDPVVTEEDGAFRFYAIMDAGSLYIFDTVSRPDGKPLNEASMMQLVGVAWEKKEGFCRILFIPKELKMYGVKRFCNREINPTCSAGLR